MICVYEPTLACPLLNQLEDVKCYNISLCFFDGLFFGADLKSKMVVISTKFDFGFSIMIFFYIINKFDPESARTMIK